MKTLIFSGFIVCISLIVIADDTKPIKLYIEDFAFLEGAWDGELEYLDYQDDKNKVKIPMKLNVTKKTSTEDYKQYLLLKSTFTEPNGALKTNENELRISDDEHGIVLDGEWKAVRKQVAKDSGLFEYEFLGNKKDNGIPSEIRQSMTLVKNKLMVKIEVKHENTDNWFVRSSYRLTKEKEN